MPFQNLARPARAIAWFLFLSYVIGAPAYLVMEFHSDLFSQRFGYSSEFIYLMGLAQVVCALLLFGSRRMVLLGLAVLTILSIGAIGSHIRIGSPLTGLPAVVYTALQVWLIVSTSRS